MADVLFIERYSEFGSMIGSVDLNELPKRIDVSQFPSDYDEIVGLMDRWIELHGEGLIGEQEEVEYQKSITSAA